MPILTKPTNLKLKLSNNIKKRRNSIELYFHQDDFIFDKTGFTNIVIETELEEIEFPLVFQCSLKSGIIEEDEGFDKIEDYFLVKTEFKQFQDYYIDSDNNNSESNKFDDVSEFLNCV